MAGRTYPAAVSLMNQHTPAPVVGMTFLRWLIGFSAGGWVGLAAVLILLGSQPRDGVLVGLVVTIQWATGTAIWMVMRRGAASLIEALGIGSALGTVLSILAGVVGNLVVTWEWWWLLPSVLAMAACLSVRSSLPPRVRMDAGWEASSWPALAGLAVGLFLVSLNLRRYPLSWPATWNGYHPDMVFFEALGYSVANLGSSKSIFMVGGDIRYHWLSYAWSGQVSSAVDAAPFMVLTRALPTVALIGLVLLTVAMADLIARDLPERLRSGSRWLAVALVVSGGYVGAVNGTILNFDSPSQALTSAWVMAWTVMVLVVITTRSKSMWMWFTIGVMAFAVTGGKVSAGVVIVAGVSFAAIIGLLLRTWWWRPALVLAVITAAAVGLAGLVFAWGSASPGDLSLLDWNGRASTIQGLDSSPGPRGVTLGTAGLLLAMSARWAGGVFLLASATWRSRVEPWLGLGFVLAGILPVVLFAQGVNETWFGLTASAPLAVLSAVGVAVGWERGSLGARSALVALLAGFLGFLAVSYIWTDQVWQSGFGRFWGPWLGFAVAVAVGLAVALARRRRLWVTFFAVAALVLTVEAALGRGTPLVAAAVGGARDGAGVRTSELTDPGLVGTSELAVESLPRPGPESTDSGESSDRAESVAGTRLDHAWSADHAAAAAFLRSESDVDAVIVTNDVDSYLVPALTRRRTFISGAPYQGVYGSTASAALIAERRKANEDFLVNTDPRVLREACSAGVEWVWLDADRSPQVDLATLGAVAFSNNSVTIIRLDSSLCPD